MWAIQSAAVSHAVSHTFGRMYNFDFETTDWVELKQIEFYLLLMLELFTNSSRLTLDCINLLYLNVIAIRNIWKTIVFHRLYLLIARFD